ncbi:MAG: hypothetical protein LBK83_11575 [Treponema sp.]|nr:hypothetical protein [Treponema sp.]
MCWYCGAPVTEEEPIGRSMRCGNCGKDLRCCRHCRFFVAGDCIESQGENPSERDRANFCDWFSLNSVFRKPGEGSKKERDTARSAKADFDSLFG